MPLDQTNWPRTAPLDETTTLLIRARNLIQRGWCREAIARDADGDHGGAIRRGRRMVFHRDVRGDRGRAGAERFDPSFVPAIRPKSQGAPNASLASMIIK